MIALAFQLAALLFAINVALMFGPPLVTILAAFSWAHDRRWTRYPNLHGLLVIVGIGALWLWAADAVGSLPDSSLYDPFFPSRGNTYYTLARGLLNVGIAAIALVLVLVVVRGVIGFFGWLFTPRY